MTKNDTILAKVAMWMMFISFFMGIVASVLSMLTIDTIKMIYFNLIAFLASGAIGLYLCKKYI